MANELETSLKNAAARVAQYIEDVASMTVETRYIQVETEAGVADFSQARPAARTEIKLDSDSETIIPMRQSKEGKLEIDNEILEIHQHNVATAIEYRARMLDALLGLLKSRLK
jgi:precorrin-4 methylase